jgi:hypothetical protein
MPNTIDLKTHHQVFKTPGVQYSVSSRGITPGMHMKDYLNIFYMYSDIHQVESVFGNTDFPCAFYGGRSFKLRRSLTPDHIAQLEEMGLHFSLTLTGHFFDESAYRESRALLRTYHKPGNSVICANDELARRIGGDFPDYSLKASIVKQIDTIEKVEEHLELYDYVVPPMDKNDDDAFLSGIKKKDRIILFGNANCAYTCPHRSCYLGFSQKNSGRKVTSVCSRPNISRLDLGEVYFDIKKLRGMGFTHFKLVPLAPPGAAAAALHLSRSRRDVS